MQRIANSKFITIAGIVIIAVGAIFEGIAQQNQVPGSYGPILLTIGTALAATGRSLLFVETKDNGSSQPIESEGSGDKQ